MTEAQRNKLFTPALIKNFFFSLEIVLGTFKNFFELFLGDLDEKFTSVGCKRERNKKQSETCE